MDVGAIAGAALSGEGPRRDNSGLLPPAGCGSSFPVDGLYHGVDAVSILVVAPEDEGKSKIPVGFTV